jgi:hypothetical protein
MSATRQTGSWVCGDHRFLEFATARIAFFTFFDMVLSNINDITWVVLRDFLLQPICDKLNLFVCAKSARNFIAPDKTGQR